MDILSIVSAAYLLLLHFSYSTDRQGLLMDPTELEKTCQLLDSCYLIYLDKSISRLLDRLVSIALYLSKRFVNGLFFFLIFSTFFFCLASLSYLYSASHNLNPSRDVCVKVRNWKINDLNTVFIRVSFYFSYTRIFIAGVFSILWL